MLSLLTRLVSDEDAQDLAEYGIALAIIGLVAGGIAVAVSVDVGTLWSNAQSVIHLST